MLTWFVRDRLAVQMWKKNKKKKGDANLQVPENWSSLRRWRAALQPLKSWTSTSRVAAALPELTSAVVG